MNIKNNFYFLREQDGAVEREFKNTLIAVLSKHKEPVRAYLVQVGYEKSNYEFNVALCFMTKEKENAYLLHSAIKIFKSMFGVKEHLDIIFLTRDQELAIRKISCPFYISEDYQVTVPDFYLISSEGYDLDHPIACYKRKRLFGKHLDGYLLCDIKPALIGQRYGLNFDRIEQIVLASRHHKYSLFPISEWPSYVYVTVPLSNNIDNYVDETNVKLIAWAELYQDVSDALK